MKNLKNKNILKENKKNEFVCEPLIFNSLTFIYIYIYIYIYISFTLTVLLFLFDN